MKSEMQIMINSGIELSQGKSYTDSSFNTPTINGEIETRIEIRRKLNRSIEFAEGTANYCGEVFTYPLHELQAMQTENNDYLQMLYDLKKDLSPYKDIAPVVLDKFDTGAIVFDSWGWEQTNIDYYCIVKRVGQFVTILPMKKATGPEEGFMTNKETPLNIDFTADPARKKVKAYFGKETGFSMRDYAGGGWVSLYKGEPQTSTHYA